MLPIAEKNDNIAMKNLTRHLLCRMKGIELRVMELEPGTVFGEYRTDISSSESFD